MRSGDFDNDGDIDIATSNAKDNTVTVLLNGGDRVFNQAGSYAVGLLSKSLIPYDLNGDQILDLAVAHQGSNDIHVLLGQGDGSFASSGAIRVLGRSPNYIDTIDLDQDGDFDLATSNFNSDSVSVFLNQLI